MTGPSIADLDRRKARIVACLYPTRIKRGFKTEEDMKRLAVLLGASRTTVREWEDGMRLPKDEQLPAIEKWLSTGDVYRYAGIGRVVGPETWPTPLAIAGETGMARADDGLKADVEAGFVDRRLSRYVGLSVPTSILAFVAAGLFRSSGQPPHCHHVDFPRLDPSGSARSEAILARGFSERGGRATLKGGNLEEGGIPPSQ